MSTIADAKVEHNYNRYNGYFFGCLHRYHRIDCYCYHFWGDELYVARAVRQ